MVPVPNDSGKRPRPPAPRGRLRFPRSGGGRLAAGLLSVIAVAYLAITLLALLLADRVLFQPPPPSYSERNLPFQLIPVGDDGDSIAIAYLPAPPGHLTFLFSHGNAEDLGDVFPLLQRLRAEGFGALGYDYRGYGRSGGGPPSARKAEVDAEAAYQFAVQQLGIPARRLVLHGRSLGSGPTLALASRRPVAGVVLESAFTSAYRVVTHVGLLPFDRFPNARLIRDLRCPLLVIHGTADQVVPFAHGRALYQRGPGPRQSLWVPGAGHNDLHQVAGRTYPEALARFAALVEAQPPATRP